MNKKLTFTAIEGSELVEASEQVVNNDFNLHIETEPKARISVYLTTVQGRPKARIFSGYADAQGNFEKDLDARVYPKYVNVRVKGQVTDAYITEAQ